MIQVVGIGPGRREGRTIAADDALRRAEVIVGYTTYVELVRDEFAEKRFVTTGMRGEKERCVQALLLSREGRRVALICSGDAQVYGMASLLLGMAEEGDEIEVVPGVTAALSAAAFLVGSGGAGFQLLGLALCLGQAVGRSLPRRLRRRGADPGGGGGVLQAGHGGVNDVAALAAGSGLFLKGTQGLAQLGHAGVQPGHTAFQRLDGGAVVRSLALDALAALPGALQFGRSIVDAEPAVLALVFQDGDLALAAGVCFGDGADVGVGLLDGQHQLLSLSTQGRAFFVKLVQLAAQAVIVGLGGLVLALLVAQRVVGAADGIDPECDLQRLALLAQFQKLLGLLAVAFQGADALFQLAQNVPQAL